MEDSVLYITDTAADSYYQNYWETLVQSQLLAIITTQN